ncbi:MAG: Hsp70 family protein [Myxococcota bacterium]|jgi:molecular chaperone DnaK|nr:Hsp70 family protein [Myxococcota bacterium]
MGIAVGIDLGTTNSCIAVVENNRATVIGDQAGRRIQPSVISFVSGDQVIAGHEAKERLIIDSENTVYSAKRLLGRDFTQPEMQALLAELPYRVKVSHDNIPSVLVQDREISLPEISALMLRHLKDMVRKTTGTEINEAVITVPANFNDVQRSSTKVAGRIAGFNVLRILNEPTAAALAYGFGGNKTERIAVYDYGGGTFDITIVELTGDIYEVLSTAGDTFLGGDDFDKRVVEDMLSNLRAEHRLDLKGDMVSLQRLRSVAEKIKCQLSVLDEVQATLREIGRGKNAIDFNYKLTRAKLETLVAPLVERSMRVCEEAMRLANITHSSLDNVVLVGGTTRIPLVRSKVTQYFGMAPRTEINPDEVVAIGASIQAFALTGVQMTRQGIPAAPQRREDPPLPLRPKSVAPTPRDKEIAARNSLPPVLEAFDDFEDLLPAVRPRGDLCHPLGYQQGAQPAAARPTASGSDVMDLSDELIDDYELDLLAPVGEPAELPAAVLAEVPAVSKGHVDLPKAALRGLPAVSPENQVPAAQSVLGQPTEAHGETQLKPHRPRAAAASAAFIGSQGASPSRSGPDGRSLPNEFDTTELVTRLKPPAVKTAPVVQLRDEVHGAWSAPVEEPSYSVPMTKMAPSALLLDVTPRAIGVGTAGGFCDLCIDRNAAIPVEQSRLFTTSTDYQSEVAIAVYQGESRRVEENTKLGEVQLCGIRPAPRGTIKIRVTFEINTDGILGVSARNEETGEAQSTRIVLSGGIDEDQVERLVRKYAGKT